MSTISIYTVQDQDLNLSALSPKVDTLHYLGDIKLLDQKLFRLAFVGTRKATKLGLQNTKKYINFIGQAYPDTIIVSGLAYGIDINSHIFALKMNLKCIVVLGSGIKNIYPSKHIEILNIIVKNGGLVLSEYDNHAPPLPHHFPLRNRIIAGISNKIIVIESTNKSGSAITAKLGLELGKDVYAIPSNINDLAYQGNNILIKNNIASLTNTPKDLFDEFVLSKTKKNTKKKKTLRVQSKLEKTTKFKENGIQINNHIKNNLGISDLFQLEKLDRKIIMILTKNSYTLEEIGKKLPKYSQTYELNKSLIKLEIQNIICKSEITGQYKLVSK